MVDFPDPVGIAVIVSSLTAIVALIVNLLSRRRDRKNERRRAHSSTLNREALVPWASYQVGYNGDDVASFFSSTPELAESPSFRRALDHVRTAYPAIADDWRRTEALMKERNDGVARGQQEIVRRLSSGVETLFGGAVQSVGGHPEDRWDVCYPEPTAGMIWTEVKAILRTPERSPNLGTRAQSVGQGSHLGYSIRWGTAEIARVKREVHSSPSYWTGLVSAAVNNEDIRTLVRGVLAVDTELQRRLANVRRGLADLTNRIESGLAIEGKCDLGF